MTDPRKLSYGITERVLSRGTPPGALSYFDISLSCLETFGLPPYLVSRAAPASNHTHTSALDAGNAEKMRRALAYVHVRSSCLPATHAEGRMAS